jgi:TRAP-type C4-dicarboxylate transport system permease small subunit
MHYLGPRLKALLYIFGDLVMFLVALVALYWSIETVHVSLNFGSVTAGLRISQAWFLMAVPVGFALIIWRLLQSFLRDVKALRDGTDVYEGDKLFD